MGKSNSFSISRSKKINSMWSLYWSQYWYQFHPIFIQRNTPGKLRRETAWNYRDVQKEKSLDFSNVLWLASDFISAWDEFTVEDTGKNAFWLRGTYLEKAIRLVLIQIIYITFMSDLKGCKFLPSVVIRG